MRCAYAAIFQQRGLVIDTFANHVTYSCSCLALFMDGILYKGEAFGKH